MHLHDIASATMNAETAIVHINYILLYKIFCYFCILLTIANVQVVELQFLKVRSFRDILRYLENSWRYLEKFWRYLELFREFLERYLGQIWGYLYLSLLRDSPVSLTYFFALYFFC